MKKEKQLILTHLDKLYWPKEKISKGDVIDYYKSVAPYLLPHLADKPQSLKRFPNGITKPSFFQKNLEMHPDWIRTVMVKHAEKNVNYLIINDLESLLYAVNLGCIELHPFLSKYKSLSSPQFILIDLDPENIDFDYVVKTALEIHDLLESIGVSSYCKTSGGRGLHICIPLNGKYSYEQSKEFAQIIALLVHEKTASFTSLERKPKKRQKKVYIDCFQNNLAQTIAAPYSLRAFPKAPTSTPLEWKEVKKGLDPKDFTISNTLKRLKAKGDLFHPILTEKTNLSKALKELKERL